MKKRIDLLASFAIYGIGLLSFLIIDIIVMKQYSSVHIANWAFSKSTIILIGSFTLLGYDQVLLRDPRLIKSYFKKFVIRALVISLLSSLIIFFISDYYLDEALLIFFGIILFSFMNYNSAAARANNRLWQSQFSKNFWKFFLLILLFLNLTENIFLSFVIVFAITLLLAFLFSKTKIDYVSKVHEDISMSSAEGLSRAFLITSITLLLAIYGEQFLINLYGDEIASVHLFKYFAVITPIALSLSGFLGFYLAPKIIRISNSDSLTRYNSLITNILIFSILNTLVSSCMGVLFMVYYFKINFADLDFFMIVILSCVSFVRGIYVINSVYVGIYANKSELFGVAKYFGIFTALYLILIMVTLFLFSGIFTAQIISVLSLMNWISRFVISDIYTKRILKIRTVVSQ